MFEIMSAAQARAKTKEVIALIQEQENAEYERAFNQVFEYNAQCIQDSIHSHTLAQDFSCEYESDEFTFRISASYEKSRTNRYTIYKDESKEYIPGSTGTFGDGFKESLSEFNFDEYR